MQIIKHTSGKAIGRISVLRSIATMEVGEAWTIAPDETTLPYAQTCCSKYGSMAGKQFHVSSTKEAAGLITIKRVK